METRPKLNLEPSKLDSLLASASMFVWIIMLCLTIYVLFKLPDTIPTHFNASGEPNDFGGKETILVLPFLATLVYWSLNILNKYPQFFNFSVTITPENAERQYTLATRMIRFLQLGLLIIFTFIILFTYLTAIKLTNGLGIWFLPIILALINIPIVITLIQSFKKQS